MRKSAFSHTYTLQNVYSVNRTKLPSKPSPRTAVWMVITTVGAAWFTQKRSSTSADERFWVKQAWMKALGEPRRVNKDCSPQQQPAPSERHTGSQVSVCLMKNGCHSFDSQWIMSFLRIVWESICVLITFRARNVCFIFRIFVQWVFYDF